MTIPPRLADVVASSVGSQQLHAEILTSPTIPATPDEEAAAPETVARLIPPAGCAQAFTNDLSSFFNPSLPDPQPLRPCAATTPITEDQPPVDFDFAAALPSTHVSLPKPTTIIRTAHNLRLPSFEQLGIASPHPDRMPLRSSPSFSLPVLGAGPLSNCEDPLHALSPPSHSHSQAGTAVEPSTTPSEEAATAKVDCIIPPFTPPSEEPGKFNWGALVNTVGLGSPPNSDPGVSPNLNSTTSAAEPGRASIVVPVVPAELSDAVRMAAWLDGVKNTISKFNLQFPFSMTPPC